MHFHMVMIIMSCFRVDLPTRKRQIFGTDAMPFVRDKCSVCLIQLRIYKACYGFRVAG